MIILGSLMSLFVVAVSEDNMQWIPPVVESPHFAPLTLTSEAPEKEDTGLAPSQLQLIPPADSLLVAPPEKLDAKLTQETIQFPETSASVAVEGESSVDPLQMQPTRHVEIDMKEVFAGAPTIYSILLLMSLGALTLWFYHMMLMREEKLMPSTFADAVEHCLAAGNWQEALSLCRKEEGLLSVLVQAAIAARHEGSCAMIERMQTEGKRATSFFWQRLSLLNDIALIAPMVGLLGTVLGMFYAFYDINRSVDSMYALFDGLGISVGTTVAGLSLAILSLFFHSTLKYRLVRQLCAAEAKAQKIALHPCTHLAQPTSAEEKTHEFNT